MGVSVGGGSVSRKVGRNAGPSASVPWHTGAGGMTGRKGLFQGKCGASEWRTADPSPSLRSGRDDKKERVVVGKGRFPKQRACVKGSGTPSPSTADQLTIQTVARLAHTRWLSSLGFS